MSTSYVFDMFQNMLFVCIGAVGGMGSLLRDSLSLLTLDATIRITHMADVPSKSLKTQDSLNC